MDYVNKIAAVTSEGSTFIRTHSYYQFTTSIFTFELYEKKVPCSWFYYKDINSGNID